MNKFQRMILDLLDHGALKNMTLRELGELLGVQHPQSVKHHLDRLACLGLIEIDKINKTISKVSRENSIGNLISLPILGSASCGDAVMFAEESLEGFLKISKDLIRPFNINNLFVIKAVGDSMNEANIDGINIEDGDYVIINKNANDFKDEDYVLSIIDNKANIKKFFREKDGNITLLSESTEDYPPIYITPDDSSYIVNGKVIRVIKNKRKKQ
jgi:repressor LexA